jgi:hypothetical protein
MNAAYSSTAHCSARTGGPGGACETGRHFGSPYQKVAENVYTEYPDPRLDDWQTKNVPGLEKIPLQLLVKLSSMSRSSLIEIRAGRSGLHRKNQEMLNSIIHRLS